MRRRLMLLVLISATASCSLVRNLERLGQYQKAMGRDDYEAAMRLVREMIRESPDKDLLLRATTDSKSEDVSALAAAPYTLGIVTLGKHQAQMGKVVPGMEKEALRYYKVGMAAAKNSPEMRGTFYDAITAYYALTRRLDKALEMLNLTLSEWRKAKSQIDLIRTYSKMANVLREQGQIELAETYDRYWRSLARAYFIPGKRPKMESSEWQEYAGWLVERLGTAAEQHDRGEVLAVVEDFKSIVEAYRRLARIDGLTQIMLGPIYTAATLALVEAGEVAAAEQAYREALANTHKAMAFIKKNTSDKEELRELLRGTHAASLYAWARLMFARGQYRRALPAFKQAHLLLEGSSQKLDSRSAAARDYWLARTYEALGDLEHAASAYAACVAINEKQRARFSVGGRLPFFRRVRREYAGHIRVLARRAATTQSEADYLEIMAAMERLRARQLGEVMKARGQRLGVLVDVGQLRARLGPDGAILAYSEADEHMIVTALSREQQVIAVVPFGPELRERVRAIAANLANPQSDVQALEDALSMLGRTLLGPALPVLEGKTRVIVLSDGVMNMIPFDLLGTGGPEGRYQPLVERAAVLYSPSLSFFLAENARETEIPRSLMALADPAYAGHPLPLRLPESALDRGPGTEKEQRRRIRLEDLPDTRLEVERIAALFPQEGVETHFGAEATESLLKRQDLHGYGVLHLATHGILDGDIPGLSEPALILATERAQDGYLTASEAMRLRLNARLTVLAACKTGAGKFYPGEGVMGLSRSFLLAGSRSVMVSLWSVSSQATVMQMQRFYQAFLKDGDVPGGLRKAKLAIRGSEQPERGRRRGMHLEGDAIVPVPRSFRHPMFWGAFIVVGR